MSRYISKKLKEKIRCQARFHCGYCLRSETLTGMPMEFEHPELLALGGKSVEENIWLSCRRCNEFKGIKSARSIPKRRSKPLFLIREQLEPTFLLERGRHTNHRQNANGTRYDDGFESERRNYRHCPSPVGESEKKQGRFLAI